jgi:hypothetical protein
VCKLSADEISPKTETINFLNRKEVGFNRYISDEKKKNRKNRHNSILGFLSV